jgi:hypothetical protein
MAVRPASLSGQIAGYGSAGHAVLPEIIQDFASNSFNRFILFPKP